MLVIKFYTDKETKSQGLRAQTTAHPCSQPTVAAARTKIRCTYIYIWPRKIQLQFKPCFGTEFSQYRPTELGVNVQMTVNVQMAKAPRGTPALSGLASLLIAMEANDFVLTSASIWSRFMNDLHSRAALLIKEKTTESPSKRIVAQIIITVSTTTRKTSENLSYKHFESL